MGGFVKVGIDALDVGCAFFESKRKQESTRMVSKKPQLAFKERARCGFFETKREAKESVSLKAGGGGLSVA